MTSNLLPMLPIDKHDVPGAEWLVACGYPAVESVPPQSFEWVQDGNWLFVLPLVG